MDSEQFMGFEELLRKRQQETDERKEEAYKEIYKAIREINMRYDCTLATRWSCDSMMNEKMQVVDTYVALGFDREWVTKMVKRADKQYFSGTKEEEEWAIKMIERAAEQYSQSQKNKED